MLGQGIDPLLQFLKPGGERFAVGADGLGVVSLPPGVIGGDFVQSDQPLLHPRDVGLLLLIAFRCSASHLVGEQAGALVDEAVQPFRFGDQFGEALARLVHRLTVGFLKGGQCLTQFGLDPGDGTAPLLHRRSFADLKSGGKGIVVALDDAQPFAEGIDRCFLVGAHALAIVVQLGPAGCAIACA